jgi:hypothetical protein
LKIYNPVAKLVRCTIRIFLLMPLLAVIMGFYPAQSPAASGPLLTGDYHLISGITMTSRPDLLPGVLRLTVNLDHRFDSGRLHVRTDV